MTCSHPQARAIPSPLVREFLRALGVLTCSDCGQVLAILGRRARTVEKS
jgi:hypothetical protein